MQISALTGVCCSKTFKVNDELELQLEENDCETYLHFKYSYYFLCKHLFSIQVISLFGMAFPNNVLIFLGKHVLTWEKWLLYCHRSTVRHYCEYNNNPLEGTNNSIKNSSIARYPQFTLENSFEVLNQISTKRLSRLATNVVTQSKKYCPIATSDVLDKLIIDGAEELKNQI